MNSSQKKSLIVTTSALIGSAAVSIIRTVLAVHFHWPGVIHPPTFLDSFMSMLYMVQTAILIVLVSVFCFQLYRVFKDVRARQSTMIDFWLLIYPVVALAVCFYFSLFLINTWEVRYLVN